MRWEPASAALAMLALVASAGWSHLVEAEPIIPPPAGRPAGALGLATMLSPAIGGIEQYDVNTDNPFVPWQERQRLVRSVPDPHLPPPPRPPPDVPQAPAPPLNLPVIQPGGGDAPRAIGFVRAGRQQSGLIVRLPGEDQDRHLATGGRAGRWTLLAIEDGNTAVFADQLGRRYRQVIGGQ